MKISPECALGRVAIAFSCTAGLFLLVEVVGLPNAAKISQMRNCNAFCRWCTVHFWKEGVNISVLNDMIIKCTTLSWILSNFLFLVDGGKRLRYEKVSYLS